MKSLRAALDAGEQLFGPGLFSGGPSTVELMGYIGFDFVFIDTEQAAAGPAGHTLEHLVRAADAAAIRPTVRVGELSPYLINNAINLGAQAIWVPHVETREEAEAIVDAARYPPRGTRGAAPVVRGAQYGVEGFDAYRLRADEETVLIAIVESVRGVDNIDEIAAVDGLDAICFGTFDFAVSLGLAQSDFYSGAGDDGVHPDVVTAAQACLAACRGSGVIPATAAWSEAAAMMWSRAGFQLMLYGLDTALLAQALRGLRTSIDAVRSQRS